MNYVFGKRISLSLTVGACCLYNLITPVYVVPIRVLPVALVIF